MTLNVARELAEKAKITKTRAWSLETGYQATSRPRRLIRQVDPCQKCSRFYL